MKEVTITFADMWWPRRVLSLVCLCRAKYRVYRGEPDKIEPEWKHEGGVATCSIRFRLLDLVKSVEYRWAPFWSEARRQHWEQDEGYAVGAVTPAVNSDHYHLSGVFEPDQRLDELVDGLVVSHLEIEGLFDDLADTPEREGEHGC